MSESWPKVAAKTAREIGDLFALGDEAKPLLTDTLTPPEFAQRLIEKELWQDATRLIAYGLPKREAVWWAIQSARQSLPPDAPPPQAAALDAAERWVLKPNEENRRAAFPAAEAADLGTAAGSCAIAAFWTGGSLAPPEAPVVPPGETLTAHAVACAIMLACVADKPEEAPQRYRKFLNEGMELARGVKPKRGGD